MIQIRVKRDAVYLYIFLEYCTSEAQLDNLKIHLIESVDILDNLLKQKLWQPEKHWQAQTFTLSHGLKS